VGGTKRLRRLLTLLFVVRHDLGLLEGVGLGYLGIRRRKVVLFLRNHLLMLLEDVVRRRDVGHRHVP